MPKSDLTKGIDYLNFAPPHEVGHPYICPKNKQWATWMNRIAKKLKYHCPIDFANVIADILVNEWNSTKVPWKRSFIKGARKFYKQQEREIEKNDTEAKNKGITTGSDARIRFLVEMELQRYRELQGRNMKPFTHDEYEEAYDILFDEEMEWQDKYRECAILLQDLLKGSQYDSMPQNSSRKYKTSRKYRGAGENKQKMEPGSGCPNARADQAIYPEELPIMKPGDDPEEWEKFQDAMRGLGGEDLKDTVQSIMAGTEYGYYQPHEEAMAFAFDCCEVSAFSEFTLANDVMKRANNRRGKKGPRVEQMWNEDDDPELLDVEATFERYGGVLIPGETMVKRVEGDLLPSDEGGTGTLFLLLDTSGSMQRYVYQLLTISWGAILAAKKAGDEIAIMEFDYGAQYRLEPTTNYSKARQILRTMSINGGTALMPALGQIETITRRRKKKPTVLIITDCGIGERGETTTPAIQKIEALGGKVMICNVHGGYPNWVEQAKQAGIDCFVAIDSGDVKTIIKSTFSNVVVSDEED